ncbi:Protein of unknown function [Pyronema omphalodes CBS 100304]|uniref:Uncharacterized protein n=1 Tax=Pyronema omphalodes (strain CBS 100304) TaxID=1076935 RepID=U4LP71_PYROM|nr:Protein of unknown function [Pyronema omphalodes CBS 100304]
MYNSGTINCLEMGHSHHKEVCKSKHHGFIKNLFWVQPSITPRDFYVLLGWPQRGCEKLKTHRKLQLR